MCFPKIKEPEPIKPDPDTKQPDAQDVNGVRDADAQRRKRAGVQGLQSTGPLGVVVQAGQLAKKSNFGG